MVSFLLRRPSPRSRRRSAGARSSGTARCRAVARRHQQDAEAPSDEVGQQQQDGDDGHGSALPSGESAVTARTPDRPAAGTARVRRRRADTAGLALGDPQGGAAARNRGSWSRLLGEGVQRASWGVLGPDRQAGADRRRAGPPSADRRPAGPPASGPRRTWPR